MGATQMLGADETGRLVRRAGLDAYAKGQYAKAMRFWLFASRAGAQDANLYIGELYERGEGVLSSPVDAAAWYRRAAVKGHVEAQFRLGRLYLRGGRISASTDGSRDRSGTVRNSPIGSRRLFSRGSGTGRGRVGCGGLATRAAEADHPVAASLLGPVLLEGKGVEPNPAAALRWLTQSVRHNEPTALFNLGEMHYRGIGVEVNHALGADWYEKAAESGHSGGHRDGAHPVDRAGASPIP